ncbi:MAG: CDP-alcohol phosphatidyltransferase family protein [Pseudomonadota bacterium]
MAVSLYDLKPRFQALLRPAAGRLAAAGITANQVTLAALALSAFGGLLIGLWPGAWAPLLLLGPILLLRMALNALDGMLAREHGQASRLGALLNELCDLASDALLYLPLALVPGMPAALLVAGVTAGLIVEAAGILALTTGGARVYDGPFGKSDRALLFGGLAFLIGLGVPTGGWLAVVLWLALAAAGLTLVRRVKKALAP